MCYGSGFLPPTFKKKSKLSEIMNKDVSKNIILKLKPS